MNAISVLKKVKLMIGSHEAVIRNNDPFKVLISTILSQRTRDANTERASKKLFNKYDSPNALSKASVKRIESLIKDAGFYRVKAQRIKEVATQVLSHGMPRTLEGLMKLPGVGRKTANCVLVFGYNEPAIPVDTHVHRISNRVGLVNTKTPEMTEKELMNLLPKDYWLDLNNLFVKFGQRICKPVKPSCSECMLKNSCKYYN